jgi:hypothetical protein
MADRLSVGAALSALALNPALIALAGAAVFAPALNPTMLAVAGATRFAPALLSTMLAVAGAALFAPALNPTMLAGAGATHLALALLPIMPAEVFCAVCFTVPRPSATTAHGVSVHLGLHVSIVVHTLHTHVLFVVGQPW